MVPDSTTEPSATGRRSSSFTVGPTSTTTTCFPRWIGSPTRSVSCTTTSEGAGDRSRREPDEVSIGSEVEDLDSVRRYVGLDSVAVLGHSWGAVLAMEYATRHPDHVSHLILVNTAPASAADNLVFREHLLRTRPARDVERMQALASSARYRAGDLEVEAEYYRLHYRVALRRPEHIDQVVGRLRTYFTEDSVLTARAIEDRLYDETWASDRFDLIPRLQALDVPTLVVHGADDFVPTALAGHIAEAIPRGRLVVLQECGHFAYLECPDEFHEHVTALFETT